MTKWTKGLLTSLLISIVLILCACDSSATSANSYPEAVQDGTVSEEYYLEYTAFLEEALPLAKQASNIGTNLALDKRSFSEKKFREEVENYLRQQKEVLPKYIGNPTTELDKDIDKIITYYIEDAERTDRIISDALENKSRMIFMNKHNAHYTTQKNILDLTDLLHDYNLN